MSQRHFQIAVIGSGFAGSLMAMMAQRLGFSTVLIERGRHPRFVIGESSTPLANLLLEEIAVEYDLPFVRPLCKWGSWQKQLPQLACGLKRGFTFYHHEFGRPFSTDAGRSNQLLVGASPNEAVADTHWYRPDFDHYLVGQAQNLGVDYLDETVLVNAHEEASGLRLSGARRDEPIDITAEFVIDATGPRGFLHQALALPEKDFAAFPPTQGLFTHFRNVGNLPDIFSTPGQDPPYPPEQAAVHHVFPGGWMWVLKFNNGITSAGVAATQMLANELDFSSGETAWKRLLERLPSVGETFRSAHAVMPFAHSPCLSFQSGAVAGTRWVLLPSAAGFVDPLLSTGFPLTLLGIKRIGEFLKSAWGCPGFQQSLAEYAVLTSLELETTSRLAGALYATLDRFDLFKELSLLYFAAASYSETVRRLNKPELADAFLLCRHPCFGPQLRQICELASRIPAAVAPADLRQTIRKTLEPFDVAGLTDSAREPWFPAVPSDLLQNAWKVNASESQIRSMLVRCGLKPD